MVGPNFLPLGTFPPTWPKLVDQNILLPWMARSFGACTLGGEEGFSPILRLQAVLENDAVQSPNLNTARQEPNHFIWNSGCLQLCLHPFLLNEPIRSIFKLVWVRSFNHLPPKEFWWIHPSDNFTFFTSFSGTDSNWKRKAEGSAGWWRKQTIEKSEVVW